MDNQYAVLICKDVLTNMKYIDRRPQLVRSVREDIEMYNHHNDGAQEFSYIIIDSYDDVKKNPNIRCI